MASDLEFTTSVDGSIKQNVQIPSQTNSVLSNMIATSPTTQPSSPSSYTPGSSTLPTALQFSKSSHPTACFFHILFKALAVTLYMLGSRMMEDIMVTVLCILLLAGKDYNSHTFIILLLQQLLQLTIILSLIVDNTRHAADFWVVKNITGRLLVGLRWWNKVDPESGATSWIYESANERKANAFDSKFFWSILYLTPLIWVFFFLSAILWLKFQCFVTLSCALILSASNVYGYYKCSADQREKVNEWMNSGAQYGMSAMLRSPNVFGRLGSMFGGAGGSTQPNTMHGTFA